MVSLDAQVLLHHRGMTGEVVCRTHGLVQSVQPTRGAGRLSRDGVLDVDSQKNRPAARMAVADDGR